MIIWNGRKTIYQFDFDLTPMDSLTQFVLGAAVGDVVAGRKVGNKAMLWGAIGGTIPDLDVFLNYVYPMPQSLLMHRGFSHSIFFAFIAGPLLGFLMHKLDKSLSKVGWTKLFFWSIITHPLLDVFTGYGTGLFVPLWDYRLQFDTIFIIDPLYTVPLLVSFIWLLIKAKPFDKRLVRSKVALMLSTGYLLITVAVKLVMLARVNAETERQSIRAEQVMVAPGFFTPLLWSVVIKEGDRYLVGYAALPDADKEIVFHEILSQHHLLKPIGNTGEVAMLAKFSKGFFAIEEKGGKLIWNDLRFGTTKGWDSQDGEFVFSFELTPGENQLSVVQRPINREISSGDLKQLVNRATGN